jgi:hypothetical protein
MKVLGGDVKMLKIPCNDNQLDAGRWPHQFHPDPASSQSNLNV